jgi:hypothetical protein
MKQTIKAISLKNGDLTSILKSMKKFDLGLPDFP